LLLEQLHRLGGEHASGDRDIEERRLVGDLASVTMICPIFVASWTIEAPYTTRPIPHQMIAPMHIGRDSPEV
jgi:hypothetical protein